MFNRKIKKKIESLEVSFRSLEYRVNRRLNQSECQHEQTTISAGVHYSSSGIQPTMKYNEMCVDCGKSLQYFDSEIDAKISEAKKIKKIYESKMAEIEKMKNE